MALVVIDDSILSSIADAIREKSGSDSGIMPGDMANEIYNLPTGEGGGEVNLCGTIITENGIYNAEELTEGEYQGYFEVEVDVPPVYSDEQIYDMGKLQQVEMLGGDSGGYLPDITPFVDDFEKVVAMIWHGDEAWEHTHIYLKGLNGTNIFTSANRNDYTSTNKTWITPSNTSYWLNPEDLSCIKVEGLNEGLVSCSGRFFMLYQE